MGKIWWKACRERAKRPENDTAVRLNVKHADGSAVDLEGPFTKAEADELFALAMKFTAKKEKTREKESSDPAIRAHCKAQRAAEDVTAERERLLARRHENRDGTR